MPTLQQKRLLLLGAQELPTIVSTAQAYWLASQKSGEYLPDLTGNGHDARFGSVGSARVINKGLAKYLRLNGTSGNYASSPDSAALSITEDIDIKVRVSANKWANGTSQIILSKLHNAGNYSYDFFVTTAGFLIFRVSGDGTALKSATSSAAISASDGTATWIRVTRDESSGDVTFYTAADSTDTPSSWSQLGTVQSTTSGTIFDGAGQLEIGSNVAGASAHFIGRVYRVIIQNGIDGTTEFDSNFTALVDGTTSFTESSSNAATVTINSASGADTNDPLQVVYSGTQYGRFPGITGNNVTVAGLANSTIYDYTVTYSDNTTADGSETSDGSGNLVLGGTQANFNAKNVKDITVVPDGGGSEVAGLDFSDTSVVATPFTSATGRQGLTWTFNRPATGRQLNIVDRTMLLFGTDDYMEIPNQANLNFGTSDSLTVSILSRHYGVTSRGLLFKDDTNGGNLGWHLRISGSNGYVASVDDGTNHPEAGTSNVTAGVLKLLSGVRNVTSDTLKSYLDGTQDGTTEDTTTATLSNTLPVRIGANSQGTPGNYMNGAFVGAAIFRKALTAAQLTQVKSELGG